MSILKYLAAILLGILFPFILTKAQTQPTLSVEKIMQDPAQWIGTSPTNIQWSDNSEQIYFFWNPERLDGDSLYKVSVKSKKISKVGRTESLSLPIGGNYNSAHSKRVYEHLGDIYLLDMKTGKSQQITNTVERESAPSFTHDEEQIAFLRDRNLFLWDVTSGQIKQVTDFRSGRKPNDPSQIKDKQEQFLKEQQVELLNIIKKREAEKLKQKVQAREASKNNPRPIYTGDQYADNIILSPSEQFVTYRLVARPDNSKIAQVPNYVTATGYIE